MAGSRHRRDPSRRDRDAAGGSPCPSGAGGLVGRLVRGIRPVAPGGVRHSDRAAVRDAQRAGRVSPGCPGAAAVLGRRYAGWWVRAVDQRVALDSVFAAVRSGLPRETPLARPSRTTVRSGLVGPVRRARRAFAECAQPQISILSRVRPAGGRRVFARVQCTSACDVLLVVRDARRRIRSRGEPRRHGEIGLPARTRLVGSRVDVRVVVNGRHRAERQRPTALTRRGGASRPVIRRRARLAERLRAQAARPTLIISKDAARALPMLPLPTAVAMKTPMSRFQIHDDLTAPEGVAPGPQGRPRRRRPAAELPRRPRRLAGRAARLRALPLRAAPRHAAAARRSSGSRSPSPSTTAPSPGIALHARTARAGGPRPRRDRAAPASGTRATSARRRCCATCARSSSSAARPPMHLHEEAREAGWADEQILEAIACVVARDASPRWSTSPARCPSTARVEESRACCAPPSLACGPRRSPSHRRQSPTLRRRPGRDLLPASTTRRSS